jgi:hypothetical protein
MSELYAYDNKRKPKQLLSLLIPSLKNQNFITLGLSKYSIGVSHIGKVDQVQAQDLFLEETKLSSLIKGATANELSQRVIEIKNIFPNKETEIISSLREAISEPGFISKNAHDPRGIIKLVKQLQNLGIKISKSKYMEISDAILKSESENLLLMAEIGVFLNSLKIDIDLSSFFNPKKIEYNLAHKKISLTTLEQILLSNANMISPAFVRKTLLKIPVKSINISATESTVSFSQMSSVYYRLFSFESKKEETTHMGLAMQEYVQYRKVNLLNKAKKANIWHLIEGISKFYEINKQVVNEVLIPILIERIDENSFKGVTLTNLIQPLKRLHNLKEDNLEKLTEKIIDKCELEILNNSRLLDVGKISTGLRELSSFNKKASKRLFEKLILLISEKMKLESKRKDLVKRIIPELEIASDNDIEKIRALKIIIGII